MGRHETFENAAPIDEAMLASTILGRGAATVLSMPSSDDAELLALHGAWEAAATVYEQAIQDQIIISDTASALESPPSREPFDEWLRLVPGWRERTGVEAAEAASAEAMDRLTEIEDRISAMPATTLAGLRLKARVARRNEDVAWPDGLGEGLVRDILAIGEPEIESDAELVRLGRQLEAARAREIAACEACNEAQREADRHMPERPAALLFRTSDHLLRLRKFLTHPDHLEGVEVTSEDVEWMKRKPYVREARRPVRPEDGLPADAHTVIEAHPWPEAQDRADEIVTAWNAWRAECARIQNEHVTPALDDAANQAGDAAADLARRIAGLPARTAAGFQVKLRALAHYGRDLLMAEVPENPDPDQLLSHSLWRDAQNMISSTADVTQVLAASDRSLGPDPVLALIADHRAAYSEWDRLASVWNEMFPDAPGYAEAMAASDKPGQREVAAYDALFAARPTTLPGVVALAEYLRKATARVTAATKPSDAERGLSVVADGLRAVLAAAEPQAAAKLSLVGMLDLASASMDDLRALRETADLVGGTAYAVCWQSRCHARGESEQSPAGGQYNVAGELMQWLGEALTDVETAVDQELARRVPGNSHDRETWLSMRAWPVINDGDPDAIEAFARELLAHAEAGRDGR